MQRAERLVLQQARAETAAGSGKAVADAELVDADVLHIFIDGHLVNNALGATGAQVDVRLSNVVAPASCLSAVEALAAGLDLQTVAVRSGLCTLARTPHLVARGDSIIVDIGGECTGVLLARGGGIEAVRSFPIGGASFTRLVSRTLGVPHLAAEDIKRTYASRRLDEMRTAELSAAFAGEIPTWLEGLRSCLDAMAGRDNLPAQIHITGGGAALGDLVQAVRAYPWLRTLRFARQPQATVVQPRLAAHISDRTRQINSHSFSVPLALAGWFVQSLHQTEANSAQRALTQVLHGMDLL
jgi:cell division ATPase FtsA